MAAKLLSNAFSVLDLDAEDDREQTSTAGVSAAAKSSTNGNHVRTLDNSKNMVLMNERRPEVNELSFAKDLEEYKMPLVWIDLEMTGLDVSVDRILEIACIVTDGNLTKSVEGPDLVIHQPKECLDSMGEWCQEHHGASGLTDKVLESTITESEAEKQYEEVCEVCVELRGHRSFGVVIDFISKHVGGSYKPLLAGNSVYVDLSFLKKYMPDLASLFSHVLVDVSSVKALCVRWYPRESKRAPSKENNHRAMDDIRESIKELEFYKENIFKASKSRK